MVCQGFGEAFLSNRKRTNRSDTNRSEPPGSLAFIGLCHCTNLNGPKASCALKPEMPKNSIRRGCNVWLLASRGIEPRQAQFKKHFFRAPKVFFHFHEFSTRRQPKMKKCLIFEGARKFFLTRAVNLGLFSKMKKDFSGGQIDFNHHLTVMAHWPMS